MNIGIVGVGLIGGSILRRLAETEHTVYIADCNEKVLSDAVRENGAKVLNSFYGLDLLILALPPDALLSYLADNADRLKGVIITDVCGVKSCVSTLCRELGLTYYGMHPMAGREVGGYYNSRANMFDGANLVVTSERLPVAIVSLIAILGFGKIVYTTPEGHDKVIAYTSQLCHILSNAFAKSPTIDSVEGMTGGSFEDLTRVGRLDINLWVSLFDHNRDNLIAELDCLIDSLTEYRDALEDKDNSRLADLLAAGVLKLTTRKK